jgi:multiple sugar transport system permease protein
MTGLKEKPETRGAPSAVPLGSGFAAALRKNYTGWLIILPSLLLLYYIIWRPIFIGAGYSFFRLSGYSILKFVGFKNYIDVLSDTFFLQTLWNTVLYVLWSLLLGLPLPLIAAILINEMVHGKGIFKFAVYLPVIIPTVAASLIWYFIYQPGSDGLLNSMLYFIGIKPLQWLQDKNMTIPLIVISATWNGFGATMMVYLASLQGLNQELYEAARIDGAGLWRRAAHIMFPHMRGILLLLLIKQIIGVFQIMEQPLAMTAGGPNRASTSLALQSYNYAFVNFQTDKALAIGMLTFIMLLGLTWVYFSLDNKIN